MMGFGAFGNLVSGINPADPYPIPLGASAWVAYWDARHGIAVDGGGDVTSWTSRVGTAVWAPITGKPHYNATGSSTSGPTVEFDAANTECFNCTDTALIAAFAGDDLPHTIVVRVKSTVTDKTIFCASLPSSDQYFHKYKHRSNGQLMSARISNDSLSIVDPGALDTSEQVVANIFTGTASTEYCAGWQTQGAQDNGTLASVTTLALGCMLVLAGQEEFLSGVVTGIGVASTALSTGQVDTVRTAMALL
jgi:hypothetical protein